jgi:O-antigen ligase
MSATLARLATDKRIPVLAAGLLSFVLAVSLVSERYEVLGLLFGVPVLVGAFLYPVIALAGMMIFIPLEGFASLIPGSFTLPRLIGLLAFACFLGNYLLQRKKINLDLSSKLFGMFVLWSFLSALWAADASAAFVMIFVMFQLFLFYAMCGNLLRDDGGLRITLFFYVAGCSIASVLAMQNFTEASYATNMQRVSAVEDMNPNDFARMVGFGLLVNLFLLFDSKARWMRNLVILAFPLLLIGLILSKSRGSWLAFLVALVAVFVVLRKTPKVYLAGLGVVMMLLVSIVAGFQLGYFDEGLQERLEQTTDGKDPTAQRTDIWKVGLVLVKNNPVMGVGFNNFHVRFNDYLSGVHTDVFPGFDKDPHNVFLSVLGETGLVGFALFGGIFYVLFVAIRRGGRTWDNAIATAIVIFTLIAGFSGTDHIRKWYWISLVAALVLAKRKNDAHFSG